MSDKLPEDSAWAKKKTSQIGPCVKKITDGVKDLAYEALHQVAKLETGRKNALARDGAIQHWMNQNSSTGELITDSNFQRFLDGKIKRITYWKHLRLTKNNEIIQIDVTLGLPHLRASNGISINGINQIFHEIQEVLEILKSASWWWAWYPMASTPKYQGVLPLTIKMESHWLGSEKIKRILKDIISEIGLKGDFANPRKMNASDTLKLAWVMNGKELQRLKKRDIVSLYIDF